jgi:hypothetical protein
MERIDLDKILNNNPEETEVSNEVVEEVQEPVEEPTNEVVEEHLEEKPVSEEVEPKEEIVEDKFPSDKFDGKYGSWDEIKQALEKPKEPEYKDDFIKKVVDLYNQKGSLEDFFKAHSTNWKEMPYEEVLKTRFKEDNKEMDNDLLEHVWNKKLAKYGDPEILRRPDDELEPDELLEKRSAIHEMQKDAENIRKEKLAEQENYLSPQAEEKPKQPEIKFEDVKKKIKESFPEVKRLLNDKKLVYKIGDNDVNIEVTDQERIVDTLADENRLIQEFVKDGKVNVDAWIDMVNYYYNGDKVRQALVDHGKTLAREEIVDDDYKNSSFKKNPSKPAEETDHALGLMKAFAQKF